MLRTSALGGFEFEFHELASFYALPLKGGTRPGLRPPHLTRSDEHSGIASNDGPRTNVFCDHGSRSNDGTPTDSYSGTDKGFGANPSLVFDSDRGLEKRHVRAGVIVRAGTKVRAVRNGDLARDSHVSEVVDEDVLPERAPVSDREIPRKINSSRWININVRT